jgi:GNAT superfamily N-acetyltransferase
MKTKTDPGRATMKTAPGILKSQVHRVKLAGGLSAVVRPIRPADGPRLAEGLRQLSPESRRRRFLFSRGSFSAEELDCFTHCDGVNHLALVVVATGPNGREHQFVAVARCIRDSADPGLAEVAIAVADDWQHHGVGEMLIQALAGSAWEAGIRYWNAILFTNNVAMRKLLELVGKKQSERSEDAGVVGLVYQLSPPTLARANWHETVGDSPPKG